LYGDQRRWFLVSTRVNNLRPAPPGADRTADGKLREDHRRLREEALARARTLLTEAAHART
jgi:hypothetical protein